MMQSNGHSEEGPNRKHMGSLRDYSLRPEVLYSFTHHDRVIATSPFGAISSTKNGPIPEERKDKARGGIREVTADGGVALEQASMTDYNVYADPFIPPFLQAINADEPRSVIKTPSRHQIDFHNYTSSFCHPTLYPNETPVPEPVRLGNGIAESELYWRNYFTYFDELLRHDGFFQMKENTAHALYGTLLFEAKRFYDTHLWALSIPGLLEDNPFVEQGDCLEIRQFQTDGEGYPIPIAVQIQNPATGHSTHTTKWWSGDVYSASVHSVDRAKETVYLAVTRLEYIDARNPLMKVNVCFPFKQKQHDALRKAVWRASQRLKEDKAQEAGFIATAGVKKDTKNQIDWLTRMLFPAPEHGIMQKSLRSIPSHNFFDGAINYEQAQAVLSVQRNDFGSLPFLISGPPGTGKTKTLVEIALQLLQNTDVAHILICAPSEAAADTLAIRLKRHFTPKQLLRLNRPNRADNEVPSELGGYCYIQNDMFGLPPFKDIMVYNVVVTSCQDASILVDARLGNSDLYHMEQNLLSTLHPEAPLPTPKLHWGALLIDEAAQATEAAVLPAIHLVCPPSPCPARLTLPRLVMAGDEHQLGPRTASRDPQFTTSLFARLFTRPLYASHPLSRHQTTPYSTLPVLRQSMLPIIAPPFSNLIRNYRSHPSILSVPSALFYNNTLIPESPEPDTKLQHSTLWRGRKWPVLFIPHTQPDEIERDGGGWYNVSETHIACDIAQRLINECGVRQNEICIMSPFAAQVKRVRALIRSDRYGGGAGLWLVNIGPVEAFQGLEKRVVILCTTRTRTRFLDVDKKRGMGIVHEKRRMNVALTRAKEALFVVGNPEVLGVDEHWKEWLAFVWRNGLVSDPERLWKGDEEGFRERRTGVLERALLVKEQSGIGGVKMALGGSTASAGFGLSFGGQSWEESLRAALGEGADEYDEEDE